MHRHPFALALVGLVRDVEGWKPNSTAIEAIQNFSSRYYELQQQWWPWSHTRFPKQGLASLPLVDIPHTIISNIKRTNIGILSPKFTS